MGNLLQAFMSAVGFSGGNPSTASNGGGCCGMAGCGCSAAGCICSKDNSCCDTCTC